MAKLTFLDIETTGLDPERHEMYELAFVQADSIALETITNRRHFWFNFDPKKADATALRITHFWERCPSWPNLQHHGVLMKTPDGGFNPVKIYDACQIIAIETANSHLVGACPNFDERFIGDKMRFFDCPPTWNYHLVDIENLVAGKLGIQPPWVSAELLPKIGIEQDPATKHTAMGDALFNYEVYRKTMER